MAQVCGDSSHDFAWDRTRQALIRVIQGAADAVADGKAVTAEGLLAVLLRLVSERTEYGFLAYREYRGFAEWLGVIDSPEVELASIGQPSHGAASDVIDDLVDEASVALAAWAEGDPEDPSAEVVLNVLESRLHREHLSRHAANPRLPNSLIYDTGEPERQSAPSAAEDGLTGATDAEDHRVREGQRSPLPLISAPTPSPSLGRSEGTSLSSPNVHQHLCGRCGGLFACDRAPRCEETRQGRKRMYCSGCQDWIESGES